jgi:protein-disulfide isomerase
MTTLKVPVTPSDHIRGSSTAPVTLLEYGDYECPMCGAAHPIVEELREHFGENLRFAFRNFPLTEVHPHALAAAEIAEFAGSHQRYWEMHDGLFEHQEQLGPELYVALAQALGLSTNALDRSLEANEYLAKLRDDFRGGVRSGVNGTPCFFIDGTRHDASWAFDDLAEAIDVRLDAKAH